LTEFHADLSKRKKEVLHFTRYKKEKKLFAAICAPLAQGAKILTHEI